MRADRKKLKSMTRPPTNDTAQENINIQQTETYKLRNK